MIGKWYIERYYVTEKSSLLELWELQGIEGYQKNSIPQISLIILFFFFLVKELVRYTLKNCSA